MIVVTTPTGNIGHHVVQDLLDAGEAVRLIVRDAAKLPQAIRDRVEVVEGSHGDTAVVDRAFEGADALFWIAPPNPSEALDDTYVNFTRPRRRRDPPPRRRPRCRGQSAWARHGVARPGGLVTASIRMVDLLNDTGAAVRGLAMPGFMENTLQQVRRSGRDAERLQLLHRAVDLVEDKLGALHEAAAEDGRLDPLRHADQQGDAQPVFQALDAAAEPGLGDVALIGRLDEVAAMHRSDEVLELLAAGGRGGQHAPPSSPPTAASASIRSPG